MVGPSLPKAGLNWGGGADGWRRAGVWSQAPGPKAVGGTARALSVADCPLPFLYSPLVGGWHLGQELACVPRECFASVSVHELSQEQEELLALGIRVFVSFLGEQSASRV